MQQGKCDLVVSYSHLKMKDNSIESTIVILIN